MCGLTGILAIGKHCTGEWLDRSVQAMTSTLRSRGPDDAGVWTDAEAGIALGHRRLSIIDLSSAGHQPMRSADGTLVMVYNGEVYNFAELRAGLEKEGVRFKSHSDTEVILEGCARWGIEATVKQLIGMFAFAVWNTRTRTLTLVRDRLGIKPLYWGRQGGLLLFASELKAVRAVLEHSPAIDRDALSAYLRHNFIPAPHTIYQGFYKLEPGCILTLREGGEPTTTRYWSCYDVALDGLRNPLTASSDEIVERLEALLRDAVKRRMVADVPLGAFLSGGIDSSTVAALMQAQSSEPVRTFTIGFEEGGYNEAQHAKQVAAHLGTEHTEVYLKANQAYELIPRLADWYDEPFADSSQIPTYLVSEVTRRDVTVALSGDGGDELFGGYNRYHWGERLRRQFLWPPFGLRKGAAKLLRSLPTSVVDGAFSIVPTRWRPYLPSNKLHKLADVLSLQYPDDLYLRLISQWESPDSIVNGATEPRGVLWDREVNGHMPGFVDRMRFMDTVTYLPDDILTKVDRASMAVSLEARVPLLDHRVVEFAWRLPVSTKRPKWHLREVLYRHVPKALVERPKMGFGVPIDVWLRGPLRDWAETLLDEGRLRREGFFDPVPIRERWAEHLSGQRHWPYHIWTILMFQLWQERWA